MAARYLYTFSVTGHGTFPVDMLRYDQCWPASTAAAVSLLLLDDEIRTVGLSSYTPPTDARWRSFGWLVRVHNKARVNS